jgi:hypothetical protein
VTVLAQSPEELELLLEDALVLQDAAAVAALSKDAGVLVEDPDACVVETRLPPCSPNRITWRLPVRSPWSATSP